MVLFGFSSEAERALFRLLIDVNKVGPTTAISVLSGLGVSGTVAAITGGDVRLLVGIKGVGRKTAERVILELKDRVQGLATVTAGMANIAVTAAGEAQAALESLGFSARESKEAVQGAIEDLGPDAEAEPLLRSALTRVTSKVRSR